MFELRNTFNNGTISRHRTLATAVKAEAQYRRRWKSHMGDCRVSVFDNDGNLDIPGHPLNEDYALEWTNY